MASFSEVTKKMVPPHSYLPFQRAQTTRQNGKVMSSPAQAWDPTGLMNRAKDDAEQAGGVVTYWTEHICGFVFRQKTNAVKLFDEPCNGNIIVEALQTSDAEHIPVPEETPSGQESNR